MGMGVFLVNRWSFFLMIDISDTRWVAEWIPDLEERKKQFEVSLDDPLEDDLIELFLEELLTLIFDLQDGVLMMDADAIRKAAHSIKGMAGTMGLAEISVLVYEVELLMKEEKLKKAKPMIDALADWRDSFGVLDD